MWLAGLGLYVSSWRRSGRAAEGSGEIVEFGDPRPGLYPAFDRMLASRVPRTSVSAVSYYALNPMKPLAQKAKLLLLASSFVAASPKELRGKFTKTINSSLAPYHEEAAVVRI